MHMITALQRNFLGHAPTWYKRAVVLCLVLNPLVLMLCGPMMTGWLIVAEFIATLAMALKCYPLQPGGLLALQAILLGLTNTTSVYKEVVTGYPIILLLVFMVAGIYFLKDLLLVIFSKILLGVRQKIILSLLFCLSSAVLSAFLDALTVVAVVITVGVGFYGVYHKIASGIHHDADHDHSNDNGVHDLHRSDLEAFRAFLRGLLMHAAVGSALGGVMTQVGEPQNLLIAKEVGWSFIEFFLHVLPVSAVVLVVGLLVCAVVERFQLFGYGTALPENVRGILQDYTRQQAAARTTSDRVDLWVQAIVAVVLILSLGFHVAEVGLIGLLIIVLATSFMGITDEHRLGKAFEAALPFTALLVVFFVIVAQIHDQHLFAPIIHYGLSFAGSAQVALFYIATGVLSALSDNVFVATIYISEVKAAFLAGTIDRAQFETLAVAINVGTNIPSVSTPNGQAAFLFLLTSAVAPLIRLSYGRMVWMALPYAVCLTVVGWLACIYLL